MAKSGRTEGGYKAQQKYIKDNIQQVKFVLNKNTEADLIAWLDSKRSQQGKAGGIQAYLKSLIKADMEKQGK